jgi:hypothetical protein
LRSSFKISEAGKVVITIDNAVRKKKTAVYRYTYKSTSTAAAEPAPVAAEPTKAEPEVSPPEVSTPEVAAPEVAAA